MAWIAPTPDRYAGKVVGNGHCVAYVQLAAEAPRTAAWRAGARVRDAADADLPAGLVIATFDPNGRYGNHTDGRSHAAILISRASDGLLVWDQWIGHPVAQRVIRYRGGASDAVNDGDQYHIATDETAGAAAA